jgi:hypothetical protein
MASFAGDDGLHDVIGDVQFADDLVIQQDSAVGGDGAHGELGLSGRSKLACNENIEGQLQGQRDFEGDWYAAAGESQDDGRAKIGPRGDGLRQDFARGSTILIDHRPISLIEQTTVKHGI